MTNNKNTDHLVTIDANESESVNIEAVELEAIQPMQELFIAAMEHRQQGNTKKAEACLLKIVQSEPRLPEPHMELAHMYLSMEQLDDARTHIEQSVQYLESGGQWLDLPEHELLSMAYMIQGEVYRSLADQDEIVFGNQEVYMDYINRARTAFQKANQVDATTVEQTGSQREWQWDKEIEQSINEGLSVSQEIAPQPEDQPHHNSSSDPKHSK